LVAMKRSRYTVLVPNFPKAGQHLLFSTLTQALIAIPDDLRRVLDNLPAPPPPSARAALRKLRAMGFLAEDEGRDRAKLEAYFHDLKSDTRMITATVLTTMACNFACTYCVEEGVTGAVHMDQDTALRASAYILQQARRHRSRAIHLSLYGGEPLVNLPAVRTVLRETGRLAREAGLTFAGSMTTNGALLTPKVVDELAGLGLVGVKVTVDGDRAHHDAKRPFKGGGGTFDVIMKNVVYAAGRIDVDLGGNWDQDNVSSFPALLDYLAERGLDRKLNRVSFKPIAHTQADRDRARAGANQEIACVYGRPETAREAVRLRRELLDRGFPTDPGVGIQMCGITLNGTHFTVDPVGLLFRCPAFVGHPEFSTGNIRDGETSIGCGASGTDLWRRCADCAYVPLCADGCMYSAYIRYGDAHRLNCQREYVEFVVTENLKTEYEQTERRQEPTSEPAARSGAGSGRSASISA
jgi:uncharacterized protein